ncbi:hypothetical protein [Streptomyces sp. DSM 40907]|uniref:hypothetical protein n=1 Tax=Streptomyces kutzneri TaxID=3051179 RepID=UPI0028D8FCBE|nr:hypothetical protein [Streptomyces sp. DSM 40907]
MLIWGDHVEPPLRTRLLGHSYGIYYTVCIGLFRPTVRAPRETLPDDPILYYTPHSDLIPGVFAARVFRHFVWVNDNTIGGYASALPALASGLDVFRIGRGGCRTPYEQLRDFLKERTGPVGIFTDGGRRDGRVRTSLVALAQDTGRAVAPLRIRADRAWEFQRQLVPRPLSTVRVVRGAPIAASVLAAAGIERARDMLQESLDALDDAPTSKAVPGGRDTRGDQGARDAS